MRGKDGTTRQYNTMQCNVRHNILSMLFVSFQCFAQIFIHACIALHCIALHCVHSCMSLHCIHACIAFTLALHSRLHCVFGSSVFMQKGACSGLLCKCSNPTFCNPRGEQIVYIYIFTCFGMRTVMIAVIVIITIAGSIFSAAVAAGPQH